MRNVIQKVDKVCSEYTDHEFVSVSLLGVVGLLAIIAFGGQLFM
jgi:hypothetical protein